MIRGEKKIVTERIDSEWECLNLNCRIFGFAIEFEYRYFLIVIFDCLNHDYKAKIALLK